MLKKSLAYLLVILILTYTAAVSVGSMRKDSAIRDEMPHIVAGYSYWTQFDYRINPEHPPLVKQLSALPLLFMPINFPSDYKAWKDNVNDQWDLGNVFLYKSGNDADKMLFWGRIPIVVLMLITGFIIYLWSAEIFRSRLAGFISLILFALSPNIIAHGRFITTDMGVSAFSVFALYSWWRFLKDPRWLTFGIASVLQGALHLAKYSSPLFLPVIGLMAIFAVFTQNPSWSLGRRLKIYIGGTVLATAIAFLIVGAWYQIFTFKMPLEVQQRLIAESIDNDIFNNAGLRTKLTALSEIALMRPYVQYMLGFFMVAAHATYGHTTYFMGEVGKNWPEYYFIAYLLKEPIASQILLYASVLILGGSVVNFFRKNTTLRSKKRELFDWFKKYNVLITFFCLIAGFMYMGYTAKLQLGIRYIVPIYPYLYIIIGGVIALFIARLKARGGSFYKFSISTLILLLVWLFTANVSIYPHYLAYFNEYIGGPENGWKYLVDSNIDWGQDLIRLKEYTQKNNIKEIKIDYFGGGDLGYYFKEGEFESWGFDKGPTTGWLAVSVDAIQWNSANEGEKNSYHWLTDNYEPAEKIGYSIFVYNIPEES